MQKTFDTIVIGLGAMGSAAAQHLAERGSRVLALEQFEPLHKRGSSHGVSRMIRQSYWEHPDYVPLLLRAYELWRRLERDTESDLLHETGGLVIGRRTGELVARSLESARLHDLPHEVLSSAEVARRFPVFRLQEDEYALFEDRAGYLRAEACLQGQVRRAEQCGAELHFNEPVTRWEAEGEGVSVWTASGTYHANRLIITAGPWASQILQQYSLPLQVTRQVLYWFNTEGSSGRFRESSMPGYIHESSEGSPMLYGFPETVDEPGMAKVALHGSSDVCTPGDIDREVHPEEWSAMQNRLRHILPGLGDRPARAETCLYTMTPDEHFIVDNLPDAPQVSIACGFSGHGFKFANLIGEILADLALSGATPQPINLFRLQRFSRKKAELPEKS